MREIYANARLTNYGDLEALAGLMRFCERKRSSLCMISRMKPLNSYSLDINFSWLVKQIELTL